MNDAGGSSGGSPDEPLDGMFKRIFSDPEFAAALESDPAQALREVGIDLDEDAVQELRRIREEGRPPEMAGQAIWPAVAVAVRVYTSPAIRAGTSPAVRVATRTQVPFRQQQDMAARLREEDEEVLRAIEGRERRRV